MKEKNNLGGTIRIHRKINSFTQIDNFVFNDPRLTIGARGVLCYLLSKPDDWTIRIKDLVNNHESGFSAIRTALNELKICGYMELISSIGKGGFTGRTHIVHEEPLFRNGYRSIENKNKNFKKGEILTNICPFKSKRSASVLNDDSE